ncbi:MAG: DUF4838 domain-containing protein [Armatimonadota bacterium]|jgi:hypothetical protein
MRIAIICLSVLIAAGACGAADFAVLDGESQAVIVHEDRAEAEAVRAWQDLRKYLQQATGREFAAVPEAEYEPSMGAPIYVGMCSPVKQALGVERYGLDRDAYVVIVREEAVMLAGASPWATYWAVCQFLEDHVGVRWLIPGPLGEDVPAHESITVGPLRETHTPKMLSRLWSGAQYGGDWNLRQRIHRRYAFHHNLIRVFPRELFDEHPEYFPQHGDARYQPGENDHAWQPCMTAPEGIELAAQAARDHFRADRMAESFSYGINDGHGYCDCKNCLQVHRPLPAWHGFSGERSVQYYTWLNQVAERVEQDYPDRMLGCLAYSAVILPPKGMRLHKNIIPYLTSNRADYWDPDFRGQDQEMLRRWSEVTEQMGIYDYAYGMGFAIPRIYNHLFQDAIRHAAGLGVKGFYAEVYPNWGLDGHKLYVMARVLWDPDVDIDAITDDWSERMFREAAEPMKAYFGLCERSWVENNFGSGHWAYRLAADPQQFRIFPPEVIERLSGYLDEARTLAADDTVRERIEFFAKTFDVTRVLAENYWAAHDLEALTETGAPMPEVAAAMRRMATKISSVDVDAFMAERVGDDPIAFHPPKQSWITPLLSGGITQSQRWAAARVATAQIERMRGDAAIDAAALRENIKREITRLFGEPEEMSPEEAARYERIVEQIRAMATKVGTAVRVEEPPTIDGEISEDLWDDADVLTDFIMWGATGQARYATRVRVVHDGANLYVALECEQDTSRLVTQAAPRDGSTWKDDSVEIFINPDRRDPAYAQFIVNAAGAFFDQWRTDEEQTYAEALNYDFDADWAATVHEGRWTAELRIPLDELEIDPARQRLLPINFVRNVQGSAGEISAWFASIKAHADPMARGWIVLE